MLSVKYMEILTRNLDKRSWERMMDVFADESGYSGTELMNADAPVFVLATCSIEVDVAEKLVKEYMPKGADEIHFAEQFAHNVDKFVDLLVRLKSFKDQIFINIAHKPYITLIKAIDHWIDPMLELKGSTLYHVRRN